MSWYFVLRKENSVQICQGVEGMLYNFKAGFKIEYFSDCEKKIRELQREFQE